MSETDAHQNERQAILTRLLDAVKQCQIRFGGRSELATDSDSRVSCLCAAWEAALQHGMKRSNKALSALKQMTEITGLGKVADLFSEMKKSDTDQVFWQYAKEHLTKHEFQRFHKLKVVNTDAGRGRAWLRAALNEHSLERYMHMLIESDEMLSHHYESWAFLRDLERSSMLPNMAAGLGSILFAITVDRPELNKGFTAPKAVHVQNSIDSALETQETSEPEPVISENTSPASIKKRDKKKKKKLPNVVSFEEDDTKGTVITRTSSTSSSGVVADAGDMHSSGETRENGEGTQDDNVFSSDALEDPTFVRDNEGYREPLHPALSRLSSSQISSPSILSGNSDRQSSLGSSSDDHDSSAFLVPIGSDGLVIDSEMVPYGDVPAAFLRSHSSSSASDHPKREIENASLALAIAQQGLSNSYGVLKSDKFSGWEAPAADTMSQDELKQAVVAMMLRKDSIQEQNRKLEGMLQHEMETSSMLRAEIEELKIQHVLKQEKEQAKLQALTKENELLKHQLKKYVSAVQMLRTEGLSKEDTLGIHLEEPQPSIPAPKPMIDYSHEASEYEKKLIQVAEMHGELMEFNELLHRQLAAKEALLRQLRDELIVLRGPLPYERHVSTDTGGQDLDSMCLQRPLINIWIPSAFLRGTASQTHHVYQVYIRIRDEEWNVYRRYSQFLDTHLRLKKVYPIVGKFDFPPKKAIGKKESRLVENRRQIFQTYLRNVINLMMEKSQLKASNVNKERLVSYLPFFNDKLEDITAKGKKRTQSPTRTIPVSEAGNGTEGLREQRQQPGL